MSERKRQFLLGARAGIPVVLAWKRHPVILSVLAAIGVDFLLYYFVI